MTPLSRFQQELLQFFQFFVEEEGRPPHLHEIALRFGLGEDSAQIHICILKKGGFLLPRDVDVSRSHVLTLWDHSLNATKLPVAGLIPAGSPEGNIQENHRFVSVPLEKLGIKSNENMFALEVTGESMTGKYIVPGDLVVFDKSKTPRDGDVVAALVDNGMTLKTFFKQDGKVFLRAENPAYRNIHPADELQIQGVMICLLRRYT